MAQHDYVIDNQSAPAARTDINNALAAIVSNNSSGSEPTVKYAGMWWVDTTANQLKIRNEANDAWVTIGDFQTGDSFSAGLPAGAINAFGQSSAPDGWLECAGSAVSRTTYAALFGSIGTTYGVGNGSSTFNLPDLRGEFIRGFDNGRGIDTGRSFGSLQTDAFQHHGHRRSTFRTRKSGSDTATVWSYSENPIGSDNFDSTEIITTSGGTPRTGSETRPRNISMLYCIKY